MTRRVVLIAAFIAAVGTGCYLMAQQAEAQAGPALLSMTDNLRGGAVALDADGGIYAGLSRNWNRVGTTPSKPAMIWTRVSTGEIFIACQNGDLYRLEADWSLTFDSSVFGGRPIPTGTQSWGQVKARYR